MMKIPGNQGRAMYSISIHKICEYLQNRIGLNPETIGHYIINRAVQNCMLAHGMSSMGEYLKVIQSNDLELRKLIESVVIPETSFFRDNAPFNALKEYVRDKWLIEHDQEVFSVLSIPCSTGEEPYSIAITLMEAGVEPERMQIHAMDISDPLLDMARYGVYTEYSFRGCNNYYKEKYFSKEPDGYHIDDQVKKVVTFSRANILDADYECEDQCYDVIFCRNLLIYFDRNAKEKALNGLVKKLSAKGILFVGHAETAILQMHGLYRMPWNMSFAYSRYPPAYRDSGRGDDAEMPKNKMLSAMEFNAVIQRLQNISDGKTPSANVNQQTYFPVNVPAENVEKSAHGIMPDGREVDAKDSEKYRNTVKKEYLGRNYEKVTGLCDRLIANNTDLAFAYEYMALVEYESDNLLQAEEYLKKALYLEPDSHEMLSILAAIAEKMGNKEGAEKHRARAARIKRRNPNAKQ